GRVRGAGRRRDAVDPPRRRSLHAVRHGRPGPVARGRRPPGLVRLAAGGAARRHRRAVRGDGGRLPAPGALIEDAAGARARGPGPGPNRTGGRQVFAGIAVLTGIFLAFGSASGFDAAGITISRTPSAYCAVILSAGVPSGSGTWRSNVPLKVSTR